MLGAHGPFRVHILVHGSGSTLSRNVLALPIAPGRLSRQSRSSTALSALRRDCVLRRRTSRYECHKRLVASVRARLRNWRLPETQPLGESTCQCAIESLLQRSALGAIAVPLVSEASSLSSTSVAPPPPRVEVVPARAGRLCLGTRILAMERPSPCLGDGRYVRERHGYHYAPAPGSTGEGKLALRRRRLEALEPDKPCGACCRPQPCRSKSSGRALRPATSFCVRTLLAGT